VEDNHAFACAQAASQAYKVPLKVVFNLVPCYLEATLRQYGFMLKGLQEIENQLKDLDIPFHLLLGDPTETVPAFLEANSAVLGVCEFSPMRMPRSWVQQVAAKCDTMGGNGNAPLPLVQVDAHNVIPGWVASDKQEYMAKQMRGKIHAKLGEFTGDLPPTPARNVQHGIDSALQGWAPTNWEQALASLEIDRTVGEVDWLTPGPAAAHRKLHEFIEGGRMKAFAADNNDPVKDVTSNMSAYIHFGHIGGLRLLRTMQALRVHRDSVDAFIEQCVVRRELADNYCYCTSLCLFVLCLGVAVAVAVAVAMYLRFPLSSLLPYCCCNHKNTNKTTDNAHYDSLQGAHGWAQETLNAHTADPREYVYTLEQFEQAETHDDLWNAAQRQMVTEGRMHGFLRMYWAKKILEWTPDPTTALRFSLYLNDRYQLDGRDPNGVVGCMWSIAGVHDMGWTERPIFGKIRFMNYAGCKRKFDVAAFVNKYSGAGAGAGAKKAGAAPITSFFSSSKKK
jgi:deoxyribodipyrimidine photo-lyase